MNVREEVLNDVSAFREKSAEPDLEASLSINDWINRLAGAARTAHTCARVGEVQQEYHTFLEIAAIAIGRAEILLPLLESDEGLAARQDLSH